MKYQAFHKPGEYPPSPVFNTELECSVWIDNMCIDGHNKELSCEGCVVEWVVEPVPLK